MIDLTNIDGKVQKGLVTFKKVGDAFAVARKQFDKDTGEAVDTEVVALDIKTLEKSKVDAQEVVVACDKVIVILNKLI